MTREEKLKELGYEADFCFNDWIFTKEDENYICSITFYSESHKFENNLYIYLKKRDILCQKDIDNLQIAFNNLKRDYEEAMKCED